jgi:hypothetical protein
VSTTTAQQLPESALAFYQFGQKLSAVGVTEVRRLWRRMTLDDIDLSWRLINADLTKTVAALQVAGAREASSYVGAVLDEQGMDAPAVATVQPLAFARGSSGLPLSDVLATVPAAVKAAIGTGARDAALTRGLTLLEGIAETQIADAARLATQAASVARPDVRTWVRVLNPPSCGRCAVMAGSVYHWNATFQRHPRCDCRTLPSTDADPKALTFDPRAYFDGLLAPEQEKRFGKSVAEDIRSGTELVKAVNAPRDAWRVRLANEREAAAPRWGSTPATGAASAQSPQTFMESLIHQVNDRNTAIRNLADAGFLAA